MKSLGLALLMTATLYAGAQQRFLVTPQQVAQALLRSGVAVSEEQVSLVAGIVASDAEPVLDVDSLQPVAQGAGKSASRAKVKLVCRQPHSCLPFYVILTLPGDGALQKLGAFDRTVAIRASAAPIAMRSGSKATLIVDGDHMQLRVPVISLQDGSIGSRIHVISADRKQTYTATILSANLLTGSL